MTAQLAQAKTSQEMVSPVASDQPLVTPLTPSKTTDVEMKQLQTKLKVNMRIMLQSALCHHCVIAPHPY